MECRMPLPAGRQGLRNANFKANSNGAQSAKGGLSLFEDHFDGFHSLLFY